METIMNTSRDTCYSCGKYLRDGDRDEHHCIYGTAKRSISEKEGLKVFLCKNCHTLAKDSVHRAPGTGRDLTIKRDAQDTWEIKYMIENDVDREMAREAWRGLFEKSYIE